MKRQLKVFFEEFDYLLMRIKSPHFLYKELIYLNHQLFELFSYLEKLYIIKIEIIINTKKSEFFFTIYYT